MTESVNRRFICLSSLIVLGDMILGLKFTRNTSDDVVGLVSAFLLVFIIVLFAKKLYDFYIKKSFKYKDLVDGVLIFLLIIISLTVGIFTVYNFSKYAAEIMLLEKNIFLPFVSFLVLGIFLGLCHKNVLLKISLLLFPLVLIFIILIFSYSVQFMNIKYLLPYKEISFRVADTFVPYFLNLLFSLVPIIVIGAENKRSSFAIGIGLGFFCLSICIINVLAVFGGELASTLNYPYSDAVSTATMGEIFSRMDGFLYASCFFSAFIKVSSCCYSVKYLLKKIITKYFV